MCLPEEPELVRFGEDHEGLPIPNFSGSQKLASLEDDRQGKRANGIKQGIGIQPNVQQCNVSPDTSAHFSSSPSPPTMTASSASSVVSSLASSAIESKPPTGKHYPLD